MIKEFRYIVRRIIVGVGIALLLMLIKTNVFAKEISSVWAPFNNNVVVVSNLDETVTFSSGGGNWSNWGFGYLRFNFSIIKVSGSSTAPLVIPNNVGVNNYACDISSTSVGNSTFTGATYSAVCPMLMGSSGLTGLYIGLTGNQQNDQASYRITLGGLFTFEKIEDVTLDTSSTTSAINNQIQNDNTNRQAIINNQNTNTQSIINNQNQNNQAIINNQNTNTQKEIESQKVCTDYHIDKSNRKDTGKLNNEGTVSPNATVVFYVTDYFPIAEDSTLTVTYLADTASSRTLCFYNANKEVISCTDSFSQGDNISIPQYSRFVRFTIRNSTDSPQFTLSNCMNGNQAIANGQQEINNTINNDNVDGASSEASSFFDDFQSNSHGLSGVITAPLRLINSLTTATCNPLQFQLPFVHDNVSLPCMRSIYENYFGIFFSLYQLITTGLVCYLVMINLYSKIHNLQNPNNDRIEVLNL